MTRSGADPRRRGGRPSVGGDRTPVGAGAPAGGAGQRPYRPVGRSSLWDDDAAGAGPQPLRASWNPVPESAGGPEGPTGDGHRTRGSAKESTPTSTRAERRKVKRRSAVGWFLHRYGWRAYALPLLVAATVVVIVQAFRPGAAVQQAADGGDGSPAAPTVEVSVPTTVTVQNPGPTTTVVTTASDTVPSPPPENTTDLATGPNPGGQFADDVKAGALPPGADFVKAGKGTWHVVAGSGDRVGTGDQLYTYTIEVEDGIQDAAADAEFAERVDSVLSDDRSWIAGGEVSLQRIDSGEPDFRISLTSQMTIRDPAYCGFDIPLEASCYHRVAGRVLINDARWVRGAVSYEGDLRLYREYAINHEVGHALGFGHQACAEDGGLAPVMMQQSFSTSNTDLHLLDPQGVVPDDGKQCRPNPYPYPLGSGN